MNQVAPKVADLSVEEVARTENREPTVAFELGRTTAPQGAAPEKHLSENGAGGEQSVPDSSADAEGERSEGGVKAVTGARAELGAKLSTADARLLHEVLISGEAALARRGDLVNLHTRLVSMFQTLNEGLAEMHKSKARQDREALSSRMDELEEAVNRMEGALRIEFEPVLRRTLDDVVQARLRPRRHGWHLACAGSVTLMAGLLLGLLFHAPLTSSLGQIGWDMTWFGSAQEPHAATATSRSAEGG